MNWYEIHDYFAASLCASLFLSLSHTQNGTKSELQRCVSQWQCLYWAPAGYWHQVSGDPCGSRLAGISLDCIKGELHDTVATRVLYLLAPAYHTHWNTPPGTLWVTLTQMSLCQCCPNGSDKMKRIREREGQMSGREQERGKLQQWLFKNVFW